jgi:putative nucleotidyltransferase with HDIG domain
MPESLQAAVFSSVRSLPMMSSAAVKVLTLLRDPNADAASFERAIRYDPSLTANILKMANSAYFGFNGQVGSIRQGVVFLGWNRLYQLLVASSVHTVMEQTVAGYGLPKGELWRHSVTTAVASENLMRQAGAPVLEERFTAALLHDVGKLVVSDFIVERLRPIEELILQGVPFETAEREVLGIDHAEAGALVLRNWSFPEPLVHAVRWHHSPDGSGSTSKVTDLVHVADTLCLRLGIGRNRDYLKYEIEESCLHRLGLEDKAIAATTDTIHKDAGNVLQSFNLDGPQEAQTENKEVRVTSDEG